MSKKVESIKHKGNNRPHIPSKEEAGYEDAIDKVQEGKKVLELNKYGNDDRDDLLRADIRSLYRHEHIAPETLIKNLYPTVNTQHAAYQQLELFNVIEHIGFKIWD